MANKLEELYKNAEKGKPYGGGNNSVKENGKIDKPTTLDYSLSSGSGKPIICNEGTDLSKIDND